MKVVESIPYKPIESYNSPLNLTLFYSYDQMIDPDIRPRWTKSSVSLPRHGTPFPCYPSFVHQRHHLVDPSKCPSTCLVECLSNCLSRGNDTSIVQKQEKWIVFVIRQWSRSIERHSKIGKVRARNQCHCQ